jgi:hypothetical protein
MLCVLCLLCAGEAVAQKKSEKKQKKELTAIATKACEEQINNDPTQASLKEGLNAQGYCGCIMEDLFSKYTLVDLEDIFTDKKKTVLVLAQFAGEGTSLDCMRNNVKNEGILKQYMLSNSFGLETCVTSIKEQGLQDQIDAEGYCKCMFDKLEKGFTLDEILSEDTYDGDRFKVLAMECVVANTR